MNTVCALASDGCARFATDSWPNRLLQGITAVVKELHVKFPMVDYHDGTMLLAVGSARPAGRALPLQVQTLIVHRRCNSRVCSAG